MIRTFAVWLHRYIGLALALFPLHSGQAFGLAGRLLIFVAGLAIAPLSLTGIIIWWRKRTTRMRYRWA